MLSIYRVRTSALDPFKPSDAEKFTMSVPKCLTPNPSHLFALLQILFLKNFPSLLNFWAFSESACCPSDVFHFTQQQTAELSLCRFDRFKVTEPPPAWSLRFIQSLSCCFVESWRTGPSSLSSVRSSAFYLCWRVAGTFKTLCASLKVWIWIPGLGPIIPGRSSCWYEPPRCKHGQEATTPFTHRFHYRCFVVGIRPSCGAVYE